MDVNRTLNARAKGQRGDLQNWCTPSLNVKGVSETTPIAKCKGHGLILLMSMYHGSGQTNMSRIQAEVMCAQKILLFYVFHNTYIIKRTVIHCSNMHLNLVQDT